MPFAPHEIENKKFVVALRGYQTDEVEAFLRAVAADYRAALEASGQERAAEIVRAAEEEAEAIRVAARREADACFEEVDRRAAELARLEADARTRLADLERLVADGMRVLA